MPTDLILFVQIFLQKHRQCPCIDHLALEGTRSTGAGKKAGGGRSRVQAGRAGKGVRANWQEGASGEGALWAKRGAATGCKLPDGATHNKLMFLSYPVTVVN